MWLFGESLTDDSGVYTLTHSGEPGYVDGYPDPDTKIALTLPGPVFDKDEKWLDEGAPQDRALDGTARSYAAFLKQSKDLAWGYLKPYQVIGLSAAWQGDQPFDLYLDETLPMTFRGKMEASPKITPRFSRAWSAEVTVQQA